LNYVSTPFEHFTYNLSAFYNNLDDLINRRTTYDPITSKTTTMFTSSGKLQTIGGELQIAYKPTDRLILDASFNYQQTTNVVFENDAAYSPHLLGYFKAIYSIRKDIILGINSYFVGSMETEWNEAPVDPAHGNLTPIGRIYKTTHGYFNLGANLRFNKLFKTALYCSLHAENLLNSNVFYGPSYINNTYLPKGTYDTGILLNATVGIKF